MAPFELPSELYSDFVHSSVVIFAGAGISTENHRIFPSTLYENICAELKLDIQNGLLFPDVMTQLCKQSNGRAKLLRKIKDRFDYVRSFPELYGISTRFHRELSTLFLVDTIVTTNWDSFFEDECGALPFVTADDYAFWQNSIRKVFKIHGSESSFGSIVATREDYEKCYERLSTGLLGAHLKLMIATKTVVYIGFSFTDDDFIRIHDILSREMHGIRPQSYIVTLDRKSDSRFRELGLIPIYTDGTHFISEVKKKLVADNLMLADERFDDIPYMLQKVFEAHRAIGSINKKEFPSVLYCGSYQDGLMHAFERMLALRRTGYYSHTCNVRNAIQSYQGDDLKKKVEGRRFFDVAYVEGYTDGNLYLLADNEMRRHMPLYFAFGYNKPIRSLKGFVKVLEKSASLAPEQNDIAIAILEKYQDANGIELHHTPFLS